ncbi:OsmC family protein [Nocardia sp. CNY236]|uniref:OsmC family protein n=1 Tax=Nocardia sp. CNY236 TaxID=1169152 RepID=UPI00042021D8|nr:OsmC family protein [Nocardia sp. CNY236]
MSLADTVRAIHAGLQGTGDGRHRFAAHTTLKPDTATQVRVRCDGHALTVDEPRSAGGDNEGPNPIGLALAALGSCQIITYRMHAARLGITIDALHVDVSATLDMSGVFGLEPTAAHSGDVVMEVRVGGPDDPSRYRELQQLVDRSCPVLSMVRGEAAVRTELKVADSE